ncbi:MAG: hypothetical protein ACPIOQ_52645, partial [Promethearchaeia archaeon]
MSRLELRAALHCVDGPGPGPGRDSLFQGHCGGALSVRSVLRREARALACCVLSAPHLGSARGPARSSSRARLLGTRLSDCGRHARALSGPLAGAAPHARSRADPPAPQAPPNEDDTEMLMCLLAEVEEQISESRACVHGASNKLEESKEFEAA